jgi:hypothetical protein
MFAVEIMRRFDGLYSSRGRAGARRISLTSLKEKLIKIGAKVVSHGRYVASQMAEVAIPRILFADILRLVSELRPPPAVARREALDCFASD